MDLSLSSGTLQPLCKRKNPEPKDLGAQVKREIVSILFQFFSLSPLPSGNIFPWSLKEEIRKNSQPAAEGTAGTLKPSKSEFGCNCPKCVFNSNCIMRERRTAAQGVGEGRAGNKRYKIQSKDIQVGHHLPALILPEVSFFLFNSYGFIPKHKRINHMPLCKRVKCFRRIWKVKKFPTLPLLRDNHS